MKNASSLTVNAMGVPDPVCQACMSNARGESELLLPSYSIHNSSTTIGGLGLGLLRTRLATCEVERDGGLPHRPKVAILSCSPHARSFHARGRPWSLLLFSGADADVVFKLLFLIRI